MRTLGLDVGSRRIGVAVSDELSAFAHPLLVLDRKGTKGDVEAIRQLARKHETDHLVVGIPCEPDGTEGHRAGRVRVLIDALRAASLRVDEIDESFSTVEATEAMLEADLSRTKRKAVVDRAAAAVILQRWLDQRAPDRAGQGQIGPNRI